MYTLYIVHGIFTTGDVRHAHLTQEHHLRMKIEKSREPFFILCTIGGQESQE